MVMLLLLMTMMVIQKCVEDNKFPKMSPTGGQERSYTLTGGRERLYTLRNGLPLRVEIIMKSSLHGHLHKWAGVTSLTTQGYS